MNNNGELQLENEIWKDITGFEGFYQISNFGRVKSLERYGLNKRYYPIRIMKPYEKNKKKPYLWVELSNGIKQQYAVARLVALHFIHNPDPINKIEVNHIDEVKQNNHVDNLEWVAPKENNNHGTRIERAVENTKGKLINHPNRSKAVIGKNIITEEIIRFPSTMEAERVLGIYHSAITGCCSHKYGYKSSGGYTWEYVDEIVLN